MKKQYTNEEIEYLSSLYDPMLVEVGDRVIVNLGITIQDIVLELVPECFNNKYCKVWKEACLGIRTQRGFTLCLSRRYVQSLGLVTLVESSQVLATSIEGDW